MISKKIQDALSGGSAIREAFACGRKLAAELGEENVFDFSLGNPATPAPAKFGKAIKEIIDNEDPVAIHGYMDNSGHQDVRAAIAEDLNERFGTSFDWHNLIMSVGAAGALNVTLKTIIDPDDEVIVFAPYFSEYDLYIKNYDGKIVVVSPNTENFQPNLDEFESKITNKTKAILINTPNNPSGAVYSKETIQTMAEILKKKQIEFNKEIYMISDEPYRELLYDGAVHTLDRKSVV